MHTVYIRKSIYVTNFTSGIYKATPGVQASIAHCGVAESALGPIANRAPPNADPPYLLGRMSLLICVYNVYMPLHIYNDRKMMSKLRP